MRLAYCYCCMHLSLRPFSYGITMTVLNNPGKILATNRASLHKIIKFSMIAIAPFVNINIQFTMMMLLFL